MPKKVNHFLGPQHRVNVILAGQRMNDVISMILEGKEKEEIINYISPKYNIKKITAKRYVDEGRKEIKKRRFFEVNNLVSLHIHRYEAIYKDLMEIGAHGYAIQALRAKETLLGFHKSGFHMKVTQGEIQSIHQKMVNNEYDFNQLGKAKIDRLEQLLEKASLRNGKNSKSIQRAN